MTSAERNRKWRQTHKSRCTCGAEISHGSTRCPSCHALTSRQWHREDVIKAIQRWASLHGGVAPSARNFAESKDTAYPALSGVYGKRGQPFRTWNDAIRAAGFVPMMSGQRRSYFPDDHDGRIPQERAKPFAHLDTETSIVSPSIHRRPGNVR